MPAPIYPWRQNNQFELLIDGEVFFPRIIEAMQRAQHAIDIELYLVSSGESSSRVNEVLIDAVARGVKVRCLLDGLGSHGMCGDDRERLLAGGVTLRFYNPISLFGGKGNFHRDHRKLLIIDEQQLFIGGTGFTDEFCQPGEKGYSQWHEQMLLVRGPVVADCLDLFERQWAASGKRLRLLPPRRQRVSVPPSPPSGDGYARLSYTDSQEHRETVQALFATISRSRRVIWLATPYFLPSWKIRRALMRAARRGVDVRLLLSGRIHDHPAIRYAGQRYYQKLLKSGIRIYEYQPRFLHLKTVLVDDWASLGSCNFDHWTLHWNLEANLNLVDTGLNRAITQSFETDFEMSREWTREQWRTLPRLHRLKIFLWGSINRAIMLWFSIKG